MGPITMKVLCLVFMLVGLASTLESCCRYQNVRCFDDNQLCDVPPLAELNGCNNLCNLGKCSTMELISCATVLAKCLPTCAPHPLDPACVKCMAGLFKQCIKCVMP